MMKKTVAIAIGTLLLGMGAASAADLAYRKAPAAAPIVAPVTYWNGFYVGVHGGYGWNSDISGGFGGGQVGYNFQMGGFVLGLEADVSGGDIGGSASIPGILNVSSSMNVFGTVRGRAGVAFDNVLLYGTGGFAWARNELDVNGLTSSRTHTGWTAGAGLEYAFAPNWSAKVEYLYARLGSENYFSNVVAGGIDSGKVDVHTIRAGVNYRFNWGGPIVANY